jgi:hypothetical protein
MKTVVKALKVSVALNAEIRIRALRKGVSAHSIMLEALEREFLQGDAKPEPQPQPEAIPERKPAKEKPAKEAGEWALLQEYIYTNGKTIMLNYYGEKEYFDTKEDAIIRLNEFRS